MAVWFCFWKTEFWTLFRLYVWIATTLCINSHNSSANQNACCKQTALTYTCSGCVVNWELFYFLFANCLPIQWLVCKMPEKFNQSTKMPLGSSWSTCYYIYFSCNIYYRKWWLMISAIDNKTYIMNLMVFNFLIYLEYSS